MPFLYRVLSRAAYRSPTPRRSLIKICAAALSAVTLQADGSSRITKQSSVRNKTIPTCPLAPFPAFMRSVHRPRGWNAFIPLTRQDRPQISKGHLTPQHTATLDSSANETNAIPGSTTGFVMVTASLQHLERCISVPFPRHWVSVPYHRLKWRHGSFVSVILAHTERTFAGCLLEIDNGKYDSQPTSGSIRHPVHVV